MCFTGGKNVWIRYNEAQAPNPTMKKTACTKDLDFQSLIHSYYFSFSCFLSLNSWCFCLIVFCVLSLDALKVFLIALFIFLHMFNIDLFCIMIGDLNNGDSIWPYWIWTLLEKHISKFCFNITKLDPNPRGSHQTLKCQQIGKSTNFGHWLHLNPIKVIFLMFCKHFSILTKTTKSKNRFKKQYFPNPSSQHWISIIQITNHCT